MNTSEYLQSCIFPREEVEQSIVDRFEKQVLLHGARLALTGLYSTLTYDQLNRLANRLARSIAKVGVQPPSRVAIFLEKDAPYLAAILAVLKAGHAYVPIDPAFPTARTQYIVSDSQAILIVTNKKNAAAAQALADSNLPIVLIDQLDETLSEQNLSLSISPDALAYIIYTSGSTGQPKGVMQNHRNVLHGCMRRTNLQRITPDDRMTLFYSPSVMGSVYCIFGTLLNGASLFPYDIREDGLTQLAEWLQGNKITIYHSVATVFRHFAASYDGPAKFPDIRLVIFGGERVLVTDVELVRKIFPPTCVLFTGLGSTETGTIRHFIITSQTKLEGKVVPIGYPVEAMEVVLLDDAGQPVKPGEIGQITVRSKYLSPGYWNKPEATQKVFLRDPKDPTITAYHTGDMGCMTPEGLLEHRGRQDFQVKIRGFRVEITEVETSLLDFPGISEAVVVAREMGEENQLVAYFTQKPGVQVALRPLRNFLQTRLPYYMIPTVYVALPAIPRTPNNKVDRKALPAPTDANQIEDDEIIEATSDTEKSLAVIWQELLRRPKVGVNQNFFHLGGHSLLATQLVSRIAQRFHVRVSMRSIFEAEHLGALALQIESAPPVTNHSERSSLTAVSRNERLPLSFAQRRMWLVNSIFPGSAAYNISNTIRLEGSLDAPALERALNEIVRRHEVLRTVFTADDLGPRQIIRPHAPAPLPKIDLRNQPPATRETDSNQLIHEYVRRPFDLEKGPLLQTALIQLEAEVSVLVLVFSHVIYDNIWSSGIFFRELGSLYAAFTQGAPSPLTELPLQFADYAHWQQRTAGQVASPEHMEYWKRQLANLPTALQVPGDFARPKSPGFRGGQITFHIPPTLKEPLADLARQESATLFMLLVSAWQLLLHRYTQQEDILVGTPTGRRYRIETEPMIGLFINTLVLRSDFSGNPDFRTLLRRSRQTTIDAFTHDELPFEDLVAELRPGREVGITPLFQHLFIHRTIAHSPWSIPGLKVIPLDVHPGGAKFDLTVSILEDEHALKGTIEYSTDLYTAETIGRLAENFKTLLGSIAGNPNLPASAFQLLAETEKQHVLREWNQTAVPYPRELCAHQLFEQQVQQHENATAIVHAGRVLTYGEVNRRANQLAAHLKKLGVGPDVLVGICVDRSAELIIGLLGILKAGGAYVPLDPSFPADRLAYMVADSNAPVLVTQASLAGRFNTGHTKHVLLDADQSTIGQLPDSNPTNYPPSTNLAYVIYTSGSTGRPKGVQLTHQALVNFLLSMQREPGITSSDVLHAVTTVSFDIAALEIFLPLVTGARVVIANHETSADPALLIESLRTNKATIMQATPVTWRMLLDQGWNGSPALKVFCGGEAMGIDLAERLLKTGAEVWNLYGPTETTIWSSVSRIKSPDDATLLGHPIANTEFQILNPALAPQPLWVPGELHIGGDGLARGYLHRDELTREKFIAHPTESNQRLYKTGDLVRRKPDGAIEFLGRMDNQIKLRGFRIELGEIEAQLATHSEVKQSVVIVREDTPGDKRLVAYVVARLDSTPEATVLRDHLRDKLPEYMLPSIFVFVESFPLTPNGKIDRRALPKPDVSTNSGSNAFEAPRTPSERNIAAIFAEVLKIGKVSRLDNFFDLGGHSLLLLQMQSRLKRNHGINLALQQLFSTPTVAELASIVDEANGKLAIDSLIQEETGIL